MMVLETLQEDGSIVAWDLREPLSTHYMNKVCDGDNEVIFRPPTFSTGRACISSVLTVLLANIIGSPLKMQVYSARFSERVPSAD